MSLADNNLSLPPLHINPDLHPVKYDHLWTYLFYDSTQIASYSYSVALQIPITAPEKKL